jgi:hypothetical protein
VALRDKEKEASHLGASDAGPGMSWLRSYLLMLDVELKKPQLRAKWVLSKH